MVKGKLYKLANLDKNKRNNYLTSYNRGRKDGIGWLWTSNWVDSTCVTFKDGDPFVALGKKEAVDNLGDDYYGITSWYEALGPDGKIHRFTPAIRSTYFRTP
tara:strand:- start:261 stop:566 length:306 start_codon:yes stop_codon:yes gene_type:complete